MSGDNPNRGTPATRFQHRSPWSLVLVARLAHPDALKGTFSSIAMSNSRRLAFSRRRRRPSFESEDPLRVRGRREDRAPAGAHGPRAGKKHAAEPQAQPRIPGLPCAMVLTVYSVLSPGTGLFCPRHSQGARCALQELSTSVGAPGPHSLAVREAIVRPHSQKRMLRSLAATAPRLHVRDDRETPLCTRRDARRMRLILAERKAEYFSREIWTGVIELKARLKLVFRRKRF
jgi:hypothetical protein